MFQGEPLMRRLRMSDQMATVLGKLAETRVAEIPVGSLVVKFSDYEPAQMGEITAEDHADPGFSALGVTWLGFPRPEPGSAYIATDAAGELFHILFNAFDVFTAGRQIAHPGDMAAALWFPDEAWYINVLELADGEGQENTLGFGTSPGSFGTLEGAHSWLVLSAGQKDWTPETRPRG